MPPAAETDPAGPLVLVAEDDAEIRTALDRILTFDGYRTHLVKDGAAALEAVTTENPDLLLLDLSMPFVDGLAVCRRLRDRGDRRPILVLTARHEVSDRVAGLDAGADDYLAKPFDMDELLARIRALLRRSTPDDPGRLTVGDLVLDTGARSVERDGEAIDLTRTEFEILTLLMTNSGQVLERGLMYEKIWGFDAELESRSLDVHVGYLRRKLEAGGGPRLIDTVRGIGFVIREPGA